MNPWELISWVVAGTVAFVCVNLMIVVAKATVHTLKRRIK